MPKHRKYSDAPTLAHLQDELSRTLVVQLRNKVAPLLDNNILTHFTDHSVLHSDGLTELIDCLVVHLQRTDGKLNEDELVVLYSACYLHDLGLHYEKAGELQTIVSLNLEKQWNELGRDRRSEIIRTYHHRISAELVHRSTTAETVIGMKLTSDYHPSEVACLCECHNLYFENQLDYTRFVELTSDSPRIRMRLLAGILRVADILEESRRRASREKANTLLLDISSQVHWWRHYYTEDITFDQTERTINIHYDFPPDKYDTYSNIVPKLQRPWIEAEYNRHIEVFNKYHVNWTMKERISRKAYSSTEAMPAQVVVAMMAELRMRHVREDELKRTVLLSTFEESRPHLEKQLDDLNLSKDEMDPAEYLLKLFEISNDLWSIGSKRSAVMIVVHEFSSNSTHLELAKRVNVGIKLMEMCLEERVPELCKAWAGRLNEAIELLPVGDDRKGHAYRVFAEWFLSLGEGVEANDSLNQAIAVCTCNKEIEELFAKQCELQLMQGQHLIAARAFSEGEHID